MKIYRLIAAVVVLGALAVTLYWANRHQRNALSTELPPAEQIKVLSVNRDDLTKVEIKKNGGDDVVLTKTDPQTWKITSPTPLVADQDQVSSVLNALAPVNSDSVIEEKPTDLKPYGLADPALKIYATTKDGKEQTLLIGDNSPTGDSAYAMREGDPRLFTIPSSTKSNLDKDVKDLQDKHLLPVDFDKASKVEITGPKLNLALSSDHGQWTIQNPKDVRADTSKLSSVVEQLRTATINTSETDQEKKDAASAFSSGAPVATVKVTVPSGSPEIQVRKNKDAYYAKTSAFDGAYKASNDLGQAINGSLDDFRDKHLFGFSFDNPNKIEMHDGAKVYSLVRNGDDWWSDGKKMDSPSVDSFIDAVRELSATKFVHSGFSTTAASVTVTSEDGKRAEHVAFSRNGGNYIGKRENDPLLYEIEAAKFDDLVKAADNMKVAAAPAPVSAPAKK